MKKVNVTPYLIVIIPSLIAVGISLLVSTLYMEKITNYVKKAKENEINDYMKFQKEQSEWKLNQLFTLFNKTNSTVESVVKKELKERVDLAYRVAHDIRGKYRKKKKKSDLKERVKDSLFEIVYNGEYDTIFVTDYNANAILLGSHLESEDITSYLDYDNRSIVYEEIQKVRRHGEGYITSRRKDGDKEIIYVRDLDMYKWYIGSSILLKTVENQIKSQLLDTVEKMPINKTDFIALYQGDAKLYLSESFKQPFNFLKEDETWHLYKEKIYYLSRYYKEFDWRVIYGFNREFIDKQVKIHQDKLDTVLAKESDYILKISSLFVLFIFMLSLTFALKNQHNV